MASEDSYGVKSSVFIRQDSSSTSLSLGFDPYQDGLNLRFVEPLEDRYKCVTCSFVLCNPYQTGCGHRFCENCIAELIETKPIAICPIDHEKIITNWIFRDNCCKREVWNLMVYCKNSPACIVKTSFGRLGDHLKKCEFETVACVNGCDAILHRKDLTGHLQTVCDYREEACQYCKVKLIFKNIKEHEAVACPNYPIQCTYNCGESLLRNELDTHLMECPEAEVECSYKKYGCQVREKRRMIREHEYSYLNEHLLLVVTINTKLEEQILDLKNTLCERNQAITQLQEQISKLDIEMKQLNGHISKNDDEVAKTQKMLAGHTDKIINIEQQSQQLGRRFSEEGKSEISALKEIIKVLKEKVECAENSIASLATFEPCLKQHESLLNAHKKLLEKNNERFRVIEATGYNGKLIWKINNYRARKQEAAEGRTPSLFSQPFYTSRCGYRLCARAYLNGDGTGKGTHLSLFFVVMKGDYDSLLVWPFKQKVTLLLLDQGPKKNHIVELFKADASSTSFQRPISEMNIASGCPKFVSHTMLESGKTATFIKDDTLFIKVVVDLSDLEDL
ncbi:TNF receptor-associated factor 5-like isoform X1 [Rhincodon typus]|uniref:TNF receptor-associated factor 5-like isoform X1 n=2 Tax=Rhincodon typus TaxID=259920 RepID=UPI0020302163|nr:TNF receptor-associated factor 5-like isoform X1 [Rhincodon typus]XP_048456606.1 TNF receptor-associated factor 5-like isoform X1 [Rhincodon typus]XP_048456607.1 TNF receptor-associated factor 5-like isoform X1 [Rhincodon typus]